MWAIFMIAYFGMGIIGVFAEVRGFSIALGISWFFSLMIALFLTYIPFVGTVAAAYGAHVGWGWSWLWAIIFFGWPQLLWLAGTLLVGLVAAIGASFGLLERRP
jgi:hypothetical protein